MSVEEKNPRSGHEGEHLPYRLGLFHNDELSPEYVQTHREIDCGPGPLPVHSHPFFELACVRKCGELDYMIGPNRYQLREGDVLFIPPGMLHGPVLPEGVRSTCIRDVIWVSQHFLNRMAQMRPNTWFYENGDPHLFRTAGTRWEELEELFDHGIAERQKGLFGWETMVVGNTMVLLSRLCRALLDEQVLVLKEERSDLLLRILDHVENHLAEKLTLEGVAAQFDVSKSTITQLFRKKLDISFYCYVTKRRLTTAKMLIDRGTPLEKVGKQVGFREHSAFYRAFRQEFGISPREYRNRDRTEP